MPTDEVKPVSQEEFNQFEPFKQSYVDIECPFEDGIFITIQIGWVNPAYPTLHLNAPALVQHMKQHKDV